jgi:hypothetical protein
MHTLKSENILKCMMHFLTKSKKTETRAKGRLKEDETKVNVVYMIKYTVHYTSATYLRYI